MIPKSSLLLDRDVIDARQSKHPLQNSHISYKSPSNLVRYYSCKIDSDG